MEIDSAEGKPNFSGTYEWPKALSGEQGDVELDADHRRITGESL